MKFLCTILGILLLLTPENTAYAQIGSQGLPRGFAPGEKEAMPAYLESQMSLRNGITTPPGGILRTIAEWEEIQALVITWTSYPAVLREIVRYAQQETKVIIHCSDSTAVKNNLLTHNVPLSSNLRFLEVPFNSIWIRDYAANSVYLDKVGDLILVDWIYNRPRPNDNAIPEHYSQLLGIPLYQTYASPHHLVHTGGNFMSDGSGHFFSSELVLDENAPGNPYYSPGKTPAEVDQTIDAFMGMSTYCKMSNLPYDGIHHIDMHMKLLDEQTLLVGEYPQGVADGPQIEANIQYLLSQYQTKWGTPFKVVRIPMPPSTSGLHPDDGAYYRTYTNSVFINKTVLVPVYREQYDTTGLRILRENLPGYHVLGIDCDNFNSNPDLDQRIISQSGAIHCITHSVGVNDPLYISHQSLADSWSNGPFAFKAEILHRSGIASATLHYTTDTSQGFQNLPMSLQTGSTEIWETQIPWISGGNEVFYYISAQANSGKSQLRPLPAPQGHWKFKVFGSMHLPTEPSPFSKPVFPNPSSGITVLPLQVQSSAPIEIEIQDLLGRKIQHWEPQTYPPGTQSLFFDTSNWRAGMYRIIFRQGNQKQEQKLMVR
ncbi:MAG: agmatine deiminase family protein [Bacteroidetes bacterium]|nr:agmatine deiminase family protein [Bacteroidota bacterium]